MNGLNKIIRDSVTGEKNNGRKIKRKCGVKYGYLYKNYSFAYRVLFSRISQFQKIYNIEIIG